MNLKAWIPLVIAVVLGLVAAMFATKLTQPQSTGIARIDGTVRVVTAARNIAPGQQITPADLAMKSITVDDAPEDTFLAVELVTGRVAVGQIIKGQPIFSGLLAPEGAQAGLQALVPEGMRAITIEVDEFSGLAGLVRPGSVVDVMSTLRDRGADEQALTRTIVQSVKVTAVGQRVSAIEEGATEEKTKLSRSVTLLVTPEQAEKIELAAVTSRPRLVLRSPGDIDDIDSPGITLADLRGDAAAGRDDPIAVRPVDMSTAEPVPTHRLGNRSPADQREVTIIRGGVESKVILEQRQPEHLITGIDIDTVDLNK